MKHHGSIGGSRGGGGFNFGRVFLIVIGIHLLFGLGLLWMAKTSTGQQFAKTYNIKLLQPEKPPEPETAEEPPPPPPPPPIETPKAETPQVAAAAPAAAAAPSIGGGGTGSSWNGRFAGESFDGPEGAFHAGVTRVFREAYRDPETDFGPATVELTVSGTGAVQSFRLTQSSGDAANDQAILTAARTVQERGLPAPPDNKARAVTVNLYPR